MLGPPKERHLDRPVLASLEALVPPDHVYRQLDAQLDLTFVRDWVRERYADRGRPSIDPVVFFKLQLVLYLEGLRSERQLMRLAEDRLSVRWYLGYGLDEPLPDHSTLTRIRERYGVETFRRFFEAVVERCITAGLVWGKELFFDATKVEANAALDSIKPRFAVDEHLRNLFAEPEHGTEELAGDLSEGESTADAAPQRLPVDPPPDLEERNSGRHDWVAEGGQPQREVRRHRYRRAADDQMSTTDPDASSMRTPRGDFHLGYQDTDVTDGGRERIILNVLVTPGEVMENQVMLDLLWQTCFRWQLRPDQVTADTTDGTLENIIPIEDAGIAMDTPLPDWDTRTPYFGPSRFTYDPDTDSYTCPAGQTLARDHAKYTEGTIVYRAAAGVCNACPLKPQCTASKEGRRIHRRMDEDYLERVRAHHQTEAYQKAMRKRQLWTEPRFAEAKLWHGLRRFRLRRLWRVTSEALMVATAQNLKRLLKGRRRGTRPASGMASPLPTMRERSSGSLLRAIRALAVRRQGRDVHGFWDPSSFSDRSGSDFINTLRRSMNQPPGPRRPESPETVIFTDKWRRSFTAIWR
ncbi:MAG: IS1182 family transposase [Chloroflexi bacterium]|nr:IS1182 family transposase [Chloroflexota bacterium]